jgi:hypothetical protein
MYWTGGFSFHFKVYVELPTFPPYHNCNVYLELKWQMLGSPIYDGQIRVIYVDYLLLSCMPVYMVLYVCYMHMIPSFHNKWHFHFKLVFESRPSNGAPTVLTKTCICCYTEHDWRHRCEFNMKNCNQSDDHLLI